MRQLLKLWNDERGFVITAELLFIVTILIIGLVAGWKTVNSAVNNELEDVANAIGSLDQSYRFGGVSGCCATTRGSRFEDQVFHADVNTCHLVFDDVIEECEDPVVFGG